MADRDPEVLIALVRLMRNLERLDLLSDDELVEAAVQARGSKKKAEAVVSAELRRRGWTWPQIGRAIGVDPSTAHKWARPLLRPDEQ